MREATDAYFAAQDTFAAWIDQCCETGPDYWEKKTPLWSSWKRYADQANEWCGTQAQLNERLEAAGYPEGKRGRVRGRHNRGIKLKPETIDTHWNN